MRIVLIADDDPTLRLLVSTSIASDFYTVVQAADGDEAWALLQQHQPAVALLDVQMPGRTGLELVQAIRADAALAATKVIILTSRGAANDIQAGLAAGADLYLTKPFSPLNLLAAVQRALGPLDGPATLEAPAEEPAPAAARAAAGRQDEALRASPELQVPLAATEPPRQQWALAEAQQLRVIQDFRAEHKRAVALAERLESAYLETITALARAVEARDDYTGGHVERVRQYSVCIAERLGLAGDALRYLEYAAVLHDVGKIGVPDAILGKRAPLAPPEWEAMRQHAAIGRRLLAGITFLAPTLDGVGSHHERWDGRGYPQGLAGKQIALVARILAVADAHDAMTTDRPYRRGRPFEAALVEIARGRGTQFDPAVVDVFLANPPGIPGAS